MRSRWMAARTARINALRGLLSEFGVARPTGSKRFVNELPELLRTRKAEIPIRLRRLARVIYREIREVEKRIQDVERELEQVIREEPTLETLRSIPGVGVLTAT